MPLTPAANPWFSPRDLLVNAPLRLVCLPHAGSGAAGFYRWKRPLLGVVDVCPVLLPGRESRLGEPAVENADELIERILQASSHVFDVPYALFGHSMGSLLAYRLATRLEQAGAAPAICFFASGRDAPQTIYSHPLMHTLDDNAFIEALGKRYGGPSALLDNPEMRELFLPILRADLTLVETFKLRIEHRLRCPVLALAGLDDRSVSQQGLAAWAETTEGEFNVQRLPGDHFYPFGAGQESLLRLIGQRLAI